MKLKTIIITAIILVVVILASTISEAYIPSETTTQYTKEELVKLMTTEQKNMDNAHNMAKSARALGYEDSHTIIITAKTDWGKANDRYNHYKEIYEDMLIKENKQKKIEEEKRRKAEEEAKWQRKMNEYPNATKVWRYLKDLGYNDYVCAGIMGNIMAEVGGQTLNINYTLSNKYYYGMCQWSKGYSEVWGADLISQCDFLAKSIRYEFNTYGFNYRKGFKYEDFLKLTNEQSAALAFAKCYERCASYTYNVRLNNATKAYNYFVN